MSNLDLDAIKGRAEEQRCLGLTDSRNLIDEVERLRSNNEATDGTDYAHPSYWRGSDAAFAAMCEQLRKILDGEDDCKGVCQEPWDTLRRRVLALYKENFSLAAHQCKYPSGDEYGNPRCLEVDKLRSDFAELGKEAVALRQQLATAKKIGAAEWQPIETAPRDGTKILAINNRGNQCVCLWQNGSCSWISMFSSGPSPFINGGCGSVLTHWMPLPEPPAELRAEVGK
jgi:hypothetical protein